MKIFQIATLIIAGLVLGACGQKQSEPAAPPVADEKPACSAQVVTDVQVVEITPGLVSRTLGMGCGEAATSGQRAIVHYTGWLLDSNAENRRGAKFDSSRDRNQPFPFPLGAGRVIKGWDQGVVGMTVGEVRELTIAPEMAYGDRDLGIIPPGSTLVFEVELLALESAPAPATQQLPE
jgi:FKBP-type peptidyl-prolyl cis-trans isomerase FkpA